VQPARADTEAGAVQAEIQMHARKELYATAKAKAHFHHQRRTARTTMTARAIRSIANNNRLDGERNWERRLIGITELPGPAAQAS